MRVHRLVEAILVSICAFASMAVLASSSASAHQGHALLGSFGAFEDPMSVAIDDSNGYVYVLDSRAEAVYRYTANGEPADFSTLGTNELKGFGFLQRSYGTFVFGTVDEVAVDNSPNTTKGDIYITSPQQSLVRVFSPDGTELTSIEGEGQYKFPCGVSLDPSGHVYVTDSSDGVYKYTPAEGHVTNGDLDSALTPTALKSRHCISAADAQEAVYVGEMFYGKVEKYESLQFSAPPAEQMGTTVASEARNLAVDQSNNTLYLQLPKSVVEYGSAGTVTGEFTSPEFTNASAVAVSDTTHEIYVGDLASKRVYRYTGLVTLPDAALQSPSNLTETSVTLNASVNPVGIETSCKVEYGTSTEYEAQVPCSPEHLGSGNAPVSVHADVSGLVPGTVYHYRFVLTNSNGPETIVGQFISGIKPTLEAQVIRKVGASSATVESEIDPSRFATTFRVEYGTDASYGSTSPVPDGYVGSSNETQQVIWSLTGLQPGTTYHVRMVATNPFGSAYGPDQVLKTFSVASGPHDSCSNAEIRNVQQSPFLPDCRAYELVSPPEKLGANVTTSPGHSQSALDGNAIKYESLTAFALSEGVETRGGEYVATRSQGGTGWKTHGITPKQATSPLQVLASSRYVAFSEDLSSGVYFALSPLVPGHPNVEHNNRNLYLRSNVLTEGPGSYELLTDSARPLPPVSPEFIDHELGAPRFAAASADWRSVLFESVSNLTPEAGGLSPTEPKAYEWHDGVERLAGVLPDGEPAEASIPGRSTNYATAHTISANGARVIFTVPQSGNAGNIYMRIAGSSTVQVNVNERAVADTAQPAEYAGATADDAKVFFISTQALTEDAVPGESQLYMYEVEAAEGRRLTRIAPAGGVFAISPDAQYIYMESGEGLAVWHSGTVQPIVTAGSNDTYRWGRGGIDGPHYLRLSEDGKTVVFAVENRALAREFGVDSGNPNGGSFEEIYVYNADTARLACASCDPSGAKAVGSATFEGRSNDFPGTIPQNVEYLSRPLSADGRYVFFDTPDPLAVTDTNGHKDVYEYDTKSGEVHPITSGTCNCDSWFVDASANGHDVFFTTPQQLVYEDVDTSVDLYDARVNGGIPSQNRPPAVACGGEECQGPVSAPPSFSVPASATFAGSGNPNFSQTAKATTKKKRGKVKNKHRRRRAKRLGRAQHGRRGAKGRK